MTIEKLPEPLSPRFSNLEPDQRRLAACARACDGIPTEELEKGILYELIAACVHLRDDLRVSEILNRLMLASSPSPRIVRRVEQLSADRAAREASAERSSHCATPECDSRPSDAGPAAPNAAPAPESAAAADVTATEKFRWGMRVRVSAKGRAEMPPTSASSVGVVTGFSRSAREVRIVRDGRTTPERFCMDYWEVDPDCLDTNESIVSGVRKPAGRGGEPLPVKRSPALAWRRPPVSREMLAARRGDCPPGTGPEYDGPQTGA